jgi:hypothetical protein
MRRRTLRSWIADTCGARHPTLFDVGKKVPALERQSHDLAWVTSSTDAALTRSIATAVDNRLLACKRAIDAKSHSDTRELGEGSNGIFDFRLVS